METHETQSDYWRLMRLGETNGDSMGAHESLRDQ